LLKYSGLLDYIEFVSIMSVAVMVELITKIDYQTGEPVVEEKPALEQFSYEGGYLLLCSDLGSQGVKIELVHPDEGSSAVILPSEKAQQCARWMLRTLAQRKDDLLYELPDILQRIIGSNGSEVTLKRGDKKKLRDTIQILRNR